MDLSVNPSDEVTGEIEPFPSKFYTQFSTAVALLSEEKSVIESPLVVDDTRSLAKAVKSLGATTKRGKDRWSIWGTGRSIKPEGQRVDAKKSVMGMSLLTSLTALTSRMMIVYGKNQLRDKSFPTLLNSLQTLGVDVHSANADDTPPLVVFGSGLEGGKISLDEKTDPRFIPAFILISPFSEEEIELKLSSGFKTPLLDGSIDIMREAGIDVSRTQRTLRILPGNFDPVEIEPPLDMFSIFPYVLAAVLTGSELEITNVERTLNLETFVLLLEKMSIDLEEDDESLVVNPPQEIGSRRYSLEKYPEALPFAAVLACVANGKTRIINLERARKMKSDRVSAIKEGLQRMGADIEESESELVIEGPADLEGATVDGFEDDAVVAALAAAGLIADGDTTIKNRAEALRASYPSFVSEFQDLGAEIGYKS